MYGATIVKCCASCMHNVGAVNETTRKCDEGEGDVQINSYCESWVMRVKDEKHPKLGQLDLQSAGKGGGKIKKQHYLNYVLNFKEIEGYDANIREIRDMYTKKFGSIYV